MISRPLTQRNRPGSAHTAGIVLAVIRVQIAEEIGGRRRSTQGYVIDAVAPTWSQSEARRACAQLDPFAISSDGNARANLTFNATAGRSSEAMEMSNKCLSLIQDAVERKSWDSPGTQCSSIRWQTVFISYEKESWRYVMC